MIYTDYSTHKNEQSNFLKRKANKSAVMTTITPIIKTIQSEYTNFLLN